MRSILILFIACCIVLAACAADGPLAAVDPAQMASQTAGPAELLVTPDTAHSLQHLLQKAFPEQRIRVSSSILSDFIGGSQIALVHDLQAMPLLQAGAPVHFYPLCLDAVVIACDREQSRVSVSSYQDLLSITEPVGVAPQDLSEFVIWAAIAKAHSDGYASEIAAGYLRKLHLEQRLHHDHLGQPVNIHMLSAVWQANEAGRKLEAILPSEGTLSLQLGLLSRAKIPAAVIQSLTAELGEAGYPVSTGHLQWHAAPAAEVTIQPLSADLPAVLSLYELSAYHFRGIYGQRNFSPANGQEHQLVNCLLIVLLLAWMRYVRNRVIQSGIQRGLLWIGRLLIAWNLLTVLKFMHPDSFYDLSRYFWYCYYIFILLSPVLSLYVAENADQIAGDSFPPWLTFNAVLSACFIALVFTNDLHQFVFRFNSPDRLYWHIDYSRTIGYYLLSGWYILMQLGAYLMLFYKRRDTPRRNSFAAPLFTLVAGLAYNLLYNFEVAPFREIPITLGMSLFIVLFWTLAIYTDLIPSNRHYRRLFENSMLDIRILDRAGGTVYQTQAASACPAELLNVAACDGSASYRLSPDGDFIYWCSNIPGGRVVTCESIRSLSKLKKTLEGLVQRQRNENRILSQQERIQGQLIFLQEQSLLTEEVERAISARIDRMEELLLQDADDVQTQTAINRQVHLLALYCKRRSEFLIKSKQNATLSGKELCRLLHESSLLLPDQLQLICRLDGSLDINRAVVCYEFFHQLLLSLIDSDGLDGICHVHRCLDSGTLTFYLVLTDEDAALIAELSNFAARLAGVQLRQKQLDDAFSLTVVVSLKEAHDA